ncbi:50S ribosomal protein L35 chloroplastic [Bienertia sinuspersici]
MAMAMASATTTILPFNSLSFQTQPKFPSSQPLSLTHFNKHFNSTLKLSSSHCISSSPILPHNRISTLHSSTSPSSSSFTVFAAKGYKMKTHKASAKRFRVTGKGKIVRRRAGKQHLLAKKNTKRKSRLSKVVQVDRSDYDNVIGALPYLKVNRNV